MQRTSTATRTHDNGWETFRVTAVRGSIRHTIIVELVDGGSDSEVDGTFTTFAEVDEDGSLVRTNEWACSDSLADVEAVESTLDDALQMAFAKDVF